MVMEHVPYTVRALLDQFHDTLSVPQRVGIAFDLSCGMLFLMNLPQGALLHRDIKSNNCLVEALDYDFSMGSASSEAQAAAASSSSAAAVVASSSSSIAPVLGRSKLADFGFGKLMDAAKSHISSRSQVGTMGWMAPELLLKAPPRYSEKSDV